ncbi:hypothetical protein CDAR_474741 [Caerostris darwini]|uniref:Uncharacterized protein n=1 Tax=Caerostris darwini TaxID=1538125 RepID=A0AAV4UAC8_9ARAC|nr:hypothetical protein CDAR_474741 [Caerostris darwini]
MKTVLDHFSSEIERFFGDLSKWSAAVIAIAFADKLPLASMARNSFLWDVFPGPPRHVRGMSNLAGPGFSLSTWRKTSTRRETVNSNCNVSPRLALR